MIRLFSVPKVNLYLEGYVPGIEKRRGEDVKILTLTFKIHPFDSRLATAIDDGLQDDSGVRAALFSLSTADPKPHLSRVNFALGCPRQNLIVYASPDTDASRIAFLQAKIAGVYARTQKDANGFAFIFKASFGPVSREEQEFVHEWLLSARSVTFEESEPGVFDEPESDDEHEPGDVIDGRIRPVPMFDDDAPPVDLDAAPITEVTVEEARPVARRGTGKGRKKLDHDGERRQQTAEGAQRAKTH